MIGHLVTSSVVLHLLHLAAVAPAPADTDDDTQLVFAPFDPEIHPDDMSCDPDGLIFLLLPHFYDCNKFFMCAHGEEVLFSCAGNTVFDFHQQECNWSWAATCTLRSMPEDVEGSGDEVHDNLIGRIHEVLEQDAVDTVASVRPLAPVSSRHNTVLNCNRPDDASRQLAYKGDCQRYWRCVSGVPQVTYCSDGLFFNEATQQCDYEANSKCDSVLPQDELQDEFIVYND